MEKGRREFDESAPGGVQTYREYTDDFVETKNQNIELPKNYTWIHKNLFYRAASQLIYAAAGVFTFFYTRLYLHVKIVNREVLKECGDSGYFIYGNHTQPVGDAFCPVRYVSPRRLYTIMGTANLGIPFLGKILPIMGGLPIPESVEGMKEFLDAIRVRIEQKKCIAIYPEAHVWPWCDFIRPFPDTSFRFPVMCNVPAFCMTSTYQKRKHGKRPRLTVYIDGPFYPDPGLNMRQARKQLHDEIYECMQERSKNSTYEYIRYTREPGV